MADVFVSQIGASYAGTVNGNQFLGTPANYYLYSDGGGGPIIAAPNVFTDNIGTVLTTYALISAKLSVQYLDFTTAVERNNSRPTTTRIYNNVTDIVYPTVLEKWRTGLVGAIGDGIGQRWRLMNAVGTLQNAFTHFVKWLSATDSGETSDYEMTLVGNGSVITPFSVQGKGGVTVRGDVRTAVRESGVDTLIQQYDGTVVLTATGLTATVIHSTGLPFGTQITVMLNVGGAATGTIAFTNSSDRIQPSAASSYSLSADGKFVRLQLIKANTWIIVGQN
jgi:hypothetical protein